jgi:hypothetical protein
VYDTFTALSTIFPKYFGHHVTTTENIDCIFSAVAQQINLSIWNRFSIGAKTSPSGACPMRGPLPYGSWLCAPGRPPVTGVLNAG